MQERFLNLSNVVRWVIIAVSCLITVGAFLGVVLVQKYMTSTWLEVILTCIGMFFSIATICLLILQIFVKKSDSENSEE